ncbi:ATP-binding cassette, subfamily C [Fulvimarina manganoxydans]|uniref:ATP-binding cassette, subfamily C n=1 Tax=Fulvimarina manganoxydans TaxID=937218 RepID=A0A1W2DL98_9HYPH|nr:type I secretion system permease/ATPase [Fulvimarina manganoxydans]SMC98304.1 ATP-binding cassette, subfamily C [Fulvimarina manganoxydans]
MDGDPNHTTLRPSEAMRKEEERIMRQMEEAVRNAKREGNQDLEAIGSLEPDPRREPSGIERLANAEKPTVKPVDARVSEQQNKPAEAAERPHREHSLVIANPEKSESVAPTSTRAPDRRREKSATGQAASLDREPPLAAKETSVNFRLALHVARQGIRRNMAVVIFFTLLVNVLVLAVPLYLFQISDRVMTSRSTDTLVMLTIVVLGAVIGQVLLDSYRRNILMRTAVQVESTLCSPILSAAARNAIGGTGKDFQVLGDMQHIRSFLTGPTLIAMLDAPLAPLFVVTVLIIHLQLGLIVCAAIVLLLGIAWVNRKMTAMPFADAAGFTARSNLTLDSLARNAQIVNALGMIPEAVRLWGRDNAHSLKSQTIGQDRNTWLSGLSRGTRLVTQVAMLGWGAHLALDGHLTGGMVIASSIIASRALAPVEGTIEGWRHWSQCRTAWARISGLLINSPLNIDRLRLPSPNGRLDVDRLLYVPQTTKKVILNGISFSLKPGEQLGVIGSSGAGKSTLGKMLVASFAPTAGNVKLDMMDLRNWDQRQLGENIGYLPQDVQLFPASIKANIARMREDASDEDIFEAAALAGIHELVASFPQGYETLIAADGAPLSGGQKQRIGLARAFFGNPRLVILDEPNSNLDTAGERALADAMRKARDRGTTIVAITQRHSLLQHVDKIMVLENGTIAAIGDRARMLNVLTGRTKIAPPQANSQAEGVSA